MPDLKKYFIYLFLERGKDKERERNINVWLLFVNSHTKVGELGTWPTAQACALTGN